MALLSHFLLDFDPILWSGFLVYFDMCFYEIHGMGVFIKFG